MNFVVWKNVRSVEQDVFRLILAYMGIGPGKRTFLFFPIVIAVYDGADTHHHCTNDELEAIVFIRFGGGSPKSRTRQRKVSDGLE